MQKKIKSLNYIQNCVDIDQKELNTELERKILLMLLLKIEYLLMKEKILLKKKKELVILNQIQLFFQDKNQYLILIFVEFQD